MKHLMRYLSVSILGALVLGLGGCAQPLKSEHISKHPNAHNEQSARVANADKTVVVYIIGLAGTGKYTIAKKISEHDYKLVDNHLINNTIFSLIGHQDVRQTPECATDKIDSIRNVILEFIKEDAGSNYVLTNQLLEKPYHNRIYHNILQTANARNSIFVPVVLKISNEERAKRITQADRKARFKITDPNEAYRVQNMLKIHHDNLLELNVTQLSANEAAQKILNHINGIKSSNPDRP